MIWLLVGFQLLFDFGVFLVLLALFARLRESRRNENHETPPAWRDELLSTLDQMLSTLTDRLPPARRAPTPMKETGARGLKGPSLLPGEASLACRLEDKRRHSAASR
jgi:hypothetical protein